MFARIWFFIVLVAFATTTMSNAIGQPIFEDLKIAASDGVPGDAFGRAVAMNQGILVVAAIDSVYVFDSNTGIEISKLTPIDEPAGGFGTSVSISDGVVAVGAPLDEDQGVDAGSVYLFDALTGSQIDKLTAIDGAAGDEFGCSVSIDSGIVSVGAKRDDDRGDSSGSAYLFDAATGIQLDKLLPDEGAANQNFGVSIASDDGIVAVGAKTHFVLGEGFTFATAYLFDASNGDQLDKFVSQNINGDLGGGFSDAIDADNGLIAVGAWARSIFFDHSGAAYVYDAESGAELQYIFPADGHDRDNFGISISISDGVVAMGAHQDDDNGFNSGSAYLFDAAGGNQIDKLLASDGEVFDLFGSSIAIDKGIVAVGAMGDDNDRGAVYLYGAEVILLGDINMDGSVNLLDVTPFVNLLSNGGYQVEADMNQDGAVNLLDVDPFVAALAG